MPYKLDDLYEAIVAEKRTIGNLQISERAHGSGGICFMTLSGAAQPKSIYMSPAYEQISFDDFINAPVSVNIAVQNDVYVNGEYNGESTHDVVLMTLTGDLAVDVEQYFLACEAYLVKHNV